jgi:glycolate oxidase FAD binding subunit
MSDPLEDLSEHVRAATASRTPLRIRGGGTKDFYGNDPVGELLDTRALNGIVAYQPSELVVTARAGTSLAELEDALARERQMLAFEPPHFGAAATVGGCVAAGLAGPRRAASGYAWGGVRDFVLGASLVDGRGGLLKFGGTVMKNVAGYDVARVLAGSLGILGVIVEVSIKVVPMPQAEKSVRISMGATEALQRLNDWAARPLPISASVWSDGMLHLRLSGAAPAVAAAVDSLGAAEYDDRDFWSDLREQRAAFFGGDAPLWRVSVPSTAAAIDSDEPQLIEWGGAQRWLRSERPAAEIRECAKALRGHATLFRGGDRSHDVFTPLAPPVAAITARLKREFDPAGIFNAGRMYRGL